jgi:hypothetical protein
MPTNYAFCISVVSLLLLMSRCKNPPSPQYLCMYVLVHLKHLRVKTAGWGTFPNCRGPNCRAGLS